jgi:acyl-CoA thioester hydrolase
MQPFKTQIRVRYHEMDALGHVNNAIYQHYLEQAAVEHSEHLGYSIDRCRELGGVYVMRRIEIDYLRPAVAGDLLEVTTWAEKMRGTRAIRRYEIRQYGKEELLVTAAATWVWVNIVTMRPQPIPEEMFAAFAPVATA